MLGVVSAPALGRRWWGGVDLGAHVSVFGDERPIVVSTVDDLAEAQVSITHNHGWDALGLTDALVAPPTTRASLAWFRRLLAAHARRRGSDRRRRRRRRRRALRPRRHQADRRGGGRQPHRPPRRPTFEHDTAISTNRLLHDARPRRTRSTDVHVAMPGTTRTASTRCLAQLVRRRWTCSGWRRSGHVAVRRRRPSLRQRIRGAGDDGDHRRSMLRAERRSLRRCGRRARGSPRASTTPTGGPRRCATATSTAATRTRRCVRSSEAIAELEGAEESLAFASGMGAIASTVFALCSSGQPHRHPAPALRRHARVPPGPVPPDGHRRHLRRRRRARRVRRSRRARPHDARDRRDAVESAARVGRPRRTRLDQGPVHARRLDVRHAARPAAARPRRRHLAALGHQGHRRPQRRHPRRDLRRRRPARRDLVLLRAARRDAVTVRRAQRTARHPHARRAHPPAERDRPLARGHARRPSRRRRRPLSRPERAPAARARHQAAPPVRHGPVVRGRRPRHGGDVPRSAAMWRVSPPRSAAPRRSCAIRPPRPTPASPPTRSSRPGVTEGLLRVSIGLEDSGDIVADFEHALETPA